VGSSMVWPFVFLAVVVGTDAWVVWDASRQRASGHAVVASVGRLTLFRPEQWFLACLVLWVVAFPMYLVARRAT
jgi:hypothetical protein